MILSLLGEHIVVYPNYLESWPKLDRFACLFTETDQLRTQPSYRCLVLTNNFLQIYGQTYQCEKVYYISVRQNTGCDTSDKPNCLKR